MSVHTSVRAPRGTEMSCLGWPQEAAYRMLHTNLDPEVAERPEDLVVYGGTGKAARDWASFDALSPGDVIGRRHDGTVLKANAKGRILFPDVGAKPGNEWYYLAENVAGI